MNTHLFITTLHPRVGIPRGHALPGVVVRALLAFIASAAAVAATYLAYRASRDDDYSRALEAFTAFILASIGAMAFAALEAVSEAAGP